MFISPLLAAAVLAAPPPVRDADRVLVVKNTKSPASVAIAEDYMKRRGVKNVVSVQCVDAALSSGNENMGWGDYLKLIEKPIREYLDKHAGIDFIVLTKGIPIHLYAAPNRGTDNVKPSLDSTLAALNYDADPKTARISFGPRGTTFANKFFNATERFTHERFGGYLVTRLDGFTTDMAKALTTRSLAAEKARPTGKVLLDLSPGYGVASKLNQPRPTFNPPKPGQTQWTAGNVEYGDFNADMLKAADLLSAANIPYELDQREAMVGKREGLMGYVSWGSNDKKYDEKAYHSLTFAPGAICETAVSSSGRTMLPAYGGQSIVMDLIAQGATGAKGYTDEPFIMAMASPSILFDRYTRGWTLAESFYAASRFVGWEDVVIGDPLCAPYGKQAAASPGGAAPVRGSRKR